MNRFDVLTTGGALKELLKHRDPTEGSLNSYKLRGKLTGDVTHQETWTRLFEHRLRGFILSRLYSGTWDREEVNQNFKLTMREGSFAYLKKHRSPYIEEPYIPLTIFNIGSLAAT